MYVEVDDMKLNDLCMRLKDMVEMGLGDYEVVFDFEEDERFLVYDGFYMNTAVIIELTAEEEEY